MIIATASQDLDPGTVGAIFVQCFGACPETRIVVDTELWAWGRNQDGQIGDGTATAHDTPPR